MRDKKCCLTCTKNIRGCTDTGWSEDGCIWQRNPDLWLDLLPDDIGKWFSRVTNDFPWQILTVSRKAGILGIFTLEGEGFTPVSEIGGEWQGPINPKEKK